VSELLDALPISVAMRDTTPYFARQPHVERYFGVKARAGARAGGGRDLPAAGQNPERAGDADEVEPRPARSSRAARTMSGEAQKVARLGRTFLITRRALVRLGRQPLGVGVGRDRRHRPDAMEQALIMEQRRSTWWCGAAQVAIVDWDGPRTPPSTRRASARCSLPARRRYLEVADYSMG